MIEFLAALITLFFTLFWVVVQIAGWAILAAIVLAPIFWVASFFIAPPPD